jgi:hypothetical protein
MATDRIAFGCVPVRPTDIETLRALGFTHILDVGGDELYTCPDDITRLENATPDCGEKEAEWFRIGIDFALHTFSKPDTRLYVHCHAGVSRSPSMALAILLALGYHLNDAETRVRQARPNILTYKRDAIRAVRDLGYADWTFYGLD